MESLLEIAQAAKHRVVAKDAYAEEVRTINRLREQSLAEEAYKTFEIALSGLDDVAHYDVAQSHGIMSTPCVVVTDILGRKLEIFHHVTYLNGIHFGGGDCDYHISAQRKKEKWYTTSVSMSKYRVAEEIGRWLAEIKNATNSLECK